MAYLYRQFDEAGELLYVGITGNVMQRTTQHEQRDWFKDVRMIKVEFFDTREEARKAERDAIRSEGPLFNLQMSTKRKPLPELRPMPPIFHLTAHEKKKLRTLGDSDLEAIKNSCGDAHLLGYKFNVSHDTIRFVRGEEMEQRLHEARFKERLEDYFVSQEKAARNEMEIILDYLRQKDENED